MNCTHDFAVLLGKDNCNSERYCKQCGKLEMYSGIVKNWIHLGFLRDLDDKKEKIESI